MAEFQTILKNYQISDTGKQLLGKVRLVLLDAPTSGGRNTIIGELLKTGDYHFITSDTTRQPRINDGVPEQDGHQYWFRNEKDLLDDLKAGKFLEAAVIHKQQVSGISLRELEKAHQDGKIAITDIEMEGVDNITEAKPDVIVIFVVPPTFEEWQKRIYKRGTMDIDEYRRRLRSSLREFKHALERPYYHFVINDNMRHAIDQIDSLARNPDIDKVQSNRAVVEAISRATEEYLKTL